MRSFGNRCESAPPSSSVRGSNGFLRRLQAAAAVTVAGVLLAAGGAVVVAAPAAAAPSTTAPSTAVVAAAQAAPGPRSAGFSLRVPLLAGGSPTGATRVAARHALRVPSSRNDMTGTPVTITGTGSTFVVTYDAGFTANVPAEQAFSAAVQKWANLVVSSVPIHVTAAFTVQAQDLLGAAGPNDFFSNVNGPVPNVVYPKALADALAGRDLNATEADISADFNSSRTDWYFGTDGNPPNTSYDFESVVLHELGHGLGFLSDFEAGGNSGCPVGDGCYGSYPNTSPPVVFDTFMTLGSPGTMPLLSLTNASATLGQALTSNNVYWDGAQGIAGSGGAEPKLYDPSSWEEGSSASHLDSATYPAGSANALMLPSQALGEVDPTPGPIMLGMFRDIGWTETTSAPLTAPGLPTDVTAVPGDSQATVSWSVPSDGGGSPILTYLVIAQANGGTPLSREVAAPATVVNFTGLTDGTAYTFVVQARNTVGDSPPSSPSPSVTPAAGTHTANESYATAAYNDFISRAPTGAELAQAAGALDGGQLTPGTFITELATSDKYLTAVVDQFYLNTLGRPSDPGGAAYWTSQLRSGALTVAQVAASFYSSDEYFHNKGGSTVFAWVTDLYAKLLHRPVDPPGRTYWIGIAASQGRLAVAYNLYQSSESRFDRVAALYEHFLQRGPDSGGKAYWADQIATHGDVALAIDLAVSSEYYTNSHPRFP